MVQYYSLGAEKRLTEIVMAGSHDAGITRGGGNAKTQKVNIRGQADAGVRLFDLRVTAVSSGLKHVNLKTYHGPLANQTVRKNVRGLEGRDKVVQSTVTGTFGEGLRSILADARDFVTNNPTEFLILKFDKCKNWNLIAAQCVAMLGKSVDELDQEIPDIRYKAGGNLNKKTLFELKGRVIVLFSHAGLQATDDDYLGAGGILGFKNLYEGEDYDSEYDGLQYFGKGGSGLTTRKSKSFQENYDTQLNLMRQGMRGNPNVMGMMYWTTTGVVGSIRERNKEMWQNQRKPGKPLPRPYPRMPQLADLWEAGLGLAVKARIPASVDPASYAGGTVLKRFLPNIVMIDFASERKCKTIFRLNRVIPTELTELELDLLASEQEQ